MTFTRQAVAETLGVDVTTIGDWAKMLSVGTQTHHKQWTFTAEDVAGFRRFLALKDVYPDLNERLLAYHGNHSGTDADLLALLGGGEKQDAPSTDDTRKILKQTVNRILRNLDSLRTDLKAVDRLLETI